MTHTLHRRGSKESLRGDFIILAMPVKGVSKEGSREKLVKILDVGLRNGAVNAGDTQQGNIYSIGVEGLRANIKDGGVLNMLFTREEDVIATLREIREMDLGMSVVVTGLMEHTKECCHAAELKPHTVARSLGIWGKTELLPTDDELEILTMCGHAMIPVSKIYELADQVAAGMITAEQAGIELCKPCICGVCNPVRAAELIRKFV